MTGSLVTDDARQALGAPSTFFLEFQARLKSAARLGPVLDLACGRGRHALAAADLGLSVVAVDRERTALEELARIETRAPGRIETLQADLEVMPHPPLELNHFGVVLVFRYLHRPLCPWIESLLTPGGLLLYETFTRDQRDLGWGPKRDDFLLHSGELPGLFPNLCVAVHEEGPSRDERAPRTARLLAVRDR